MADRIIIFSSNPGRVETDMPVTLPRPRDWNSPDFRRIVDEVYLHLTTGHIGKRGIGAKTEQITVGYRLPDAPLQQLIGLMETLLESQFDGRADLPVLADYQNLDADDLFPLLEALHLLGLANVAGGDVELTPIGRTFAEAELLQRKQILAEQLMKQIPLAGHIRKVLEERPNHHAPAARFLGELEDHLEEEDAAAVLDTVINWGRHAELFAYDYDSEALTLEDPDGVA
jgi:NitT/TauT family transport system ATP-binding protein